MEHLALLKRWFYRSTRSGEIFFADIKGGLPLRRLVRGIARVYRGEKPEAAPANLEDREAVPPNARVCRSSDKLFREKSPGRNQNMADAKVLSNQKTILSNQATIIKNQKAILANQIAIVKNQKTIVSNQGIIKTNQSALNEILKNQKLILAAVAR